MSTVPPQLLSLLSPQTAACVQVLSIASPYILMAGKELVTMYKENKKLAADKERLAALGQMQFENQKEHDRRMEEMQRAYEGRQREREVFARKMQQISDSRSAEMEEQRRKWREEEEKKEEKHRNKIDQMRREWESAMENMRGDSQEKIEEENRKYGRMMKDLEMRHGEEKRRTILEIEKIERKNEDDVEKQRQDLARINKERADEDRRTASEKRETEIKYFEERKRELEEIGKVEEDIRTEQSRLQNQLFEERKAQIEANVGDLYLARMQQYDRDLVAKVQDWLEEHAKLPGTWHEANQAAKQNKENNDFLSLQFYFDELDESINATWRKSHELIRFVTVNSGSALAKREFVSNGVQNVISALDKVKLSDEFSAIKFSIKEKRHIELSSLENFDNKVKQLFNAANNFQRISSASHHENICGGSEKLRISD